MKQLTNYTILDSSIDSERQAQHFICILFGDIPGGHAIAISFNAESGFTTEYFSTEEVYDGTAAKRIVELSTDHQVYIRMTSIKNDLKVFPGRGDATISAGISGLWLDVDCREGSHQQKNLPSKEEGLDFLKGLPWRCSLIIDTGGGLHAYWLFEAFMAFETDAQRDEFANLLRRFQHTIRSWMAERGWHLDNTADLARLLRPAGTLNHKSTPPKQVKIIYQADDRYDPADIDKELLPLPVGSVHAKPNGHRAEMNADLELIASQCPFMAHAREDAATLPEPDWYTALNIIGHCKNGGVLAHEWSKPYPDYQAMETDQKLAHAQETPPMTCQGIRDKVGGTWCDSCLQRERIHSPIRLGYGETRRFRSKLGAEVYSDVTNARQFVREYGAILHYVHSWKAWLIYENGIWKRDESSVVVQLAKTLSDQLGAEAKSWIDEVKTVKEEETKKAAKNFYRHTTSTPNRLQKLLELAQSEPGIPVSHEALDRHPLKIVCPNGVIDLETSELLLSDPNLRITKAIDVAYDPDAQAPRWERSLMEMMGAPTSEVHADMSALELETRAEAEARARARELVAYLQRAIGYSLSGSVKEQVMFILHGSGANGKSLFINILMKLLGPLAMKATSNLLMSKGRHEHPTEIADLFGKRFVAAVETGEGHRLNEPFVKEATGGDPITARRLYENFWTFEPSHKLWLATNHRPRILDTSHGMWRRLHLVPFNVQFQKPDDPVRDTTLPLADLDLENKLTEELPGILAWAVRGCLQWQKQGLKPPQMVQDATEVYKAEQDALGQFIEDCCLLGEDHVENATRLWDAFTDWALDGGEYKGTQTTFGRKMGERGFKKMKSGGLRHYVGIRLKNCNNMNHDIF